MRVVFVFLRFAHVHAMYVCASVMQCTCNARYCMYIAFQSEGFGRLSLGRVGLGSSATSRHVQCNKGP